MKNYYKVSSHSKKQCSSQFLFFIVHVASCVYNLIIYPRRICPFFQIVARYKVFIQKIKMTHDDSPRKQ